MIAIVKSNIKDLFRNPTRNVMNKSQNYIHTKKYEQTPDLPRYSGRLVNSLYNWDSLQALQGPTAAAAHCGSSGPTPQAPRLHMAVRRAPPLPGPAAAVAAHCGSRGPAPLHALRRRPIAVRTALPARAPRRQQRPIAVQVSIVVCWLAR